jgi:hypothetical protein
LSEQKGVISLAHLAVGGIGDLPEHPYLTRIVLGVAAISYIAQTAAAALEGFTPDVQDQLAEINQAFAEETKQADELEKQGINRLRLNHGTVRAVAQGVGEMFGFNLSQTPALRGIINVPEVRLTTEPLDAREWFSKRIDGGMCNSKRIANTLPIFYLDDSDHRPPFLAGWEDVFHRCTITCPVAREHYSNFPAELEKDESVLSVARYNSPQRLLQYAFRTFLHATYPHGSNALVEANSGDHRLWLIDHEKILLAPSNSSDMDMLHRMIKYYKPALAACELVSRISDDDIERSLSSIPERFWKHKAVFINSPDAVAYFVQRLRRWRELFSISANEKA